MKTVKDLNGLDTIWSVEYNGDQYNNKPLHPYRIKKRTVFGLGVNSKKQIVVHFEEPGDYDKGVVQSPSARVIKDKYGHPWYINYEDAYKALRRRTSDYILSRDEYIRKLRKANWDLLNGPIKKYPNA